MFSYDICVARYNEDLGFAVRKENILQHPKELYVKIRNDPNFQNTYCEVSHFWERMFFPFFTNKWIDKNL